mgnify:CR=1 FL=1
MDVESKILIAAISASSAIFGAVISQVVTVVRDWLDKKHQRNVLLRNKYEELAGLITDSQEWGGSLLTSSSLKELRNKPPINARKALILSYIYFPLLRSGCENYITGCVNFQNVLIDNHEFKDGIDCGTQAIHKNEGAVLESSSKLRESRQDIDDLIIQYSSKYAKA